MTSLLDDLENKARAELRDARKILKIILEYYAEFDCKRCCDSSTGSHEPECGIKEDIKDYFSKWGHDDGTE